MTKQKEQPEGYSLSEMVIAAQSGDVDILEAHIDQMKKERDAIIKQVQSRIDGLSGQIELLAAILNEAKEPGDG